ncbi:WD repeat-containing protein 43 isoform X1 [Capsicum chacoense]
MAREKLKSIVTSFTIGGEYLAVLSPDGTVRVWNTSSGSLFGQWRPENSGDSFSYMVCCIIGKKRRKEQCLYVALGSDDGNVLAVDISTGLVRWRKDGALPSGAAGLFFVGKGRRIHAVAANGLVFEMNSKTGEVIKEFKGSKKPISAVAHSTDEKIIAVASDKLRFLSSESGKELLKFSPDSDAAQRIWLSNDAQFAVTAGFGEKQLQVWKLDFGDRAADYGHLVSMKHPPVMVECRNNCKGEDGQVVLAISEKGVCYVWNFESVTGEVAKPIKITVKASKRETDEGAGRAKKNLVGVIAARLYALDEDVHLRALIAYGSIESLEFTSVDISSPGKDIVIAAGEQAEKEVAAVQENGHLKKGADMEVEDANLIQRSKVTNKRPASELDVTGGTTTITDNGNGEPIDGVQIDDLNEPTMGEKLAMLDLADKNEDKSNNNLESAVQAKPPSADSVHVLLKQALHADDRALLIDCLYRQDEKVIANSVSLLNPSDVLKLLQSLLSIIQSRGAVLACALPWLRSLLLQHASGIMSQESSLLALNSLYQLIDARLSTLHQALQLSSSLELLYAGTIDDGDGDDEDGAIQPVIYEDNDDSDEEGSEVTMETESIPDVEEPEAFSDISDHEGSDGMSE